MTFTVERQYLTENSLFRPQMETDQALARRMFQARHHKEGVVGRSLSLREIGEAVSSYLNRKEPYDPSVIARWLKGEQEPKTREQWVGLARAFSVDVGWLAFGEHSQAPMLRDDDTRPEYIKVAERLGLPVAGTPVTETKTAPTRSAVGGKKRRR